MVLCLAAGGAMAEVIAVNDMRELPDADPNDGVCDADLQTPGNQCTLRAAVMHAHTTLEDDTKKKSLLNSPGQSLRRLNISRYGWDP